MVSISEVMLKDNRMKENKEHDDNSVDAENLHSY